MTARKAFLLRIDPDLWDALEKWAADELRSVNGQIEYLLAHAVRAAGRTKTRGDGSGRSSSSRAPGGRRRGGPGSPAGPP
jgi:hypothetical protein